MATLSRMFPWRGALVNVQADTLIRWHRKGFRLFWRWKSKPTGRPGLPKNLLIRDAGPPETLQGEVAMLYGVTPPRLPEENRHAEKPDARP